MSTEEPRDKHSYLYNLAKEFMGFDEDPTDSDVQDKFRELSSKFHPDISDLDPEEAEEKFKASNTSRDILIGNIGDGDTQRIHTGISILERALHPSSVRDAKDETLSSKRGEVGGGERFSTTKERKPPSDFSGAQFNKMGGSERKEIAQEIAIGYAVKLRYNAVQGLLKEGITEEDFYDAVNDYISDTEEGLMDNEEYYEAASHLIRNNVGKGVFVGAIEKVESELASEYAPGATIDRVAEIIATMIAQGNIDIGLQDMMAGSRNFRSPGSGNFRRSSRSNFRKPGGENSRFRKG